MLLVATLFMAAPSFAQAPATQPSTAPVSKPPSEPAMTEATTGSTTGTATTMPTPQPAEPNAPITMNFKDASLNTVLDYLSEAAGLVIVGDPRVEGRITIVSRRNVSVGEAVDLLDSTLRENGYAAIRVGARNLKIVPIDDAKKEFIPVTKGVNPEEIEPNDRIITQIIPTRSADAVKLKNDLASLIPPSADIAANASSNMLIVTAPQSVVRQVVEIVHAIDVETFRNFAGAGLSPQERQRHERGQADQRHLQGYHPEPVSAARRRASSVHVAGNDGGRGQGRQESQGDRLGG